MVLRIRRLLFLKFGRLSRLNLLLSLKQLLGRDHISFRLFSICAETDIYSLEDLKSYLRKNRNFDQLIDLVAVEKSFLQIDVML